jgi:hypothetical protein
MQTQLKNVNSSQIKEIKFNKTLNIAPLTMGLDQVNTKSPNGLTNYINLSQ